MRKTQKKKRKSLLSRFAIFLVAVIVIAGICGWLFVNGKLGKLGKFAPFNIVKPEDETFDTNNSDESGNVLDPDDVALNAEGVRVITNRNITNILLIGGDSRVAGGGGNSDSMIIVSINKKTKEIKLTSLMRDMYVKIPGYSDNRINASYAFGGIELLDETIKRNLGVKIDGNVAVDFDSFLEAISHIGNLDIQLSAEEAYYMNTAPWDHKRNGVWNLHEGVNSLTPDQILAYSRIRRVGNNDFERTERQRRVIMAAFSKVKQMSVKEVLDLADEILPCITTDMSNSSIISLVTKVAKSDMEIAGTFRVPVDGTYDGAMIRGMYVIVQDLAENSRLLQEFIYGESASGK